MGGRASATEPFTRALIGVTPTPLPRMSCATTSGLLRISTRGDDPRVGARIDSDNRSAFPGPTDLSARTTVNRRPGGGIDPHSAVRFERCVLLSPAHISRTISSIRTQHFS